MAERMLRGETGTAAYPYRGIETAGREVTKHAYFTRIPLEDTFWSISVTAPESEAFCIARRI